MNLGPAATALAGVSPAVGADAEGGSGDTPVVGGNVLGAQSGASSAAVVPAGLTGWTRYPPVEGGAGNNDRDTS